MPSAIENVSGMARAVTTAAADSVTSSHATSTSGRVIRQAT